MISSIVYSEWLAYNEIPFRISMHLIKTGDDHGAYYQGAGFI